MLYSWTAHNWQYGACALHAGYLRLKHALRICTAFPLVQCCKNTPQSYVIRTLYLQILSPAPCPSLSRTFKYSNFNSYYVNLFGTNGKLTFMSVQTQKVSLLLPFSACDTLLWCVELHCVSCSTIRVPASITEPGVSLWQGSGQSALTQRIITLLLRDLYWCE
jgi:hypothetical protein